MWTFPSAWLDLFPFLEDRTKNFFIDSDNVDYLLWIASNYGTLSLKDAYLFKHHPQTDLAWVAYIWNSYIPPSYSLMV